MLILIVDLNLIRSETNKNKNQKAVKVAAKMIKTVSKTIINFNKREREVVLNRLLKFLRT